MKIYKKIFLTALVLAVFGCINLFAQSTGIVNLKIEPQSKLTINGTSTLHDFTIRATEIRGYLTIIRSKTDSTSNNFNKNINELNILIPVKKLDSGDGSMNKNMNKALKSIDNPNITYKLLSINPIALPDSVGKSVVLKTTGELSIAGKKNIIEMNVESTLQKDSTYRFTGEKKIKMADYGIEPPTMLFGTIKVRPVVIVKFDVEISLK